MYGQYRVLTPTMYRSRVHATMATTRQALSMDEERPRTPSKRKGGGIEDELALRPASLSPRTGAMGVGGPAAGRRHLRQQHGGGGGRQQQDSLELELGASATRVWSERDKGGGGQRSHSGGSSSYRGRSNNSNNTNGERNYSI